MQKNRRKKKLVNPPLQLRLVGSFAGIAALGILLQFLLVGQRLIGTLSESGATTPGELANAVPGILLEVLAITLLIVLPILIAVGVTLTFRIVGPLGRLERHLREVARGETSSPFKLRAGDELNSLCEAINLATEPARAQQPRVGEVERPSSDVPNKLSKAA